MAASEKRVDRRFYYNEIVPNAFDACNPCSNIKLNRGRKIDMGTILAVCRFVLTWAGSVRVDGINITSSMCYESCRSPTLSLNAYALQLATKPTLELRLHL